LAASRPSIGALPGEVVEEATTIRNHNVEARAKLFIELALLSSVLLPAT
jgi:hypothetical protein